MLLDPAKEEFHLPPGFVQSTDAQRRQRSVVGDEQQSLAGLGISVADTAQRLRVVFGRLVALQHERLIEAHARGSIDGMRVSALRIHVLLRTRDEEAARLVQPMQSCEIHIAAIHHVERPGFRNQLIEDVHVVELPVADVNEAGDVAAQVQQRVHFHRGLGRAKRRPWKQRQRQIDRCGVQRVGGVRQIDPEGLLGIQLASNTDQTLSEVGVDAPIARGVRIGEGVARDPSPDTHVVEPLGLRAQACLDVAQTLAKIQLRERHAQVLIHAREALDLVIATVPRHTALEHHRRQVIHQLRKNQLPRMHRHDPRRPVRGSQCHLLGPKSLTPSKSRFRQCLQSLIGVPPINVGTGLT